MSSFLPSCSIRKVTCAAVTKADTCAQMCRLKAPAVRLRAWQARSRQLGQKVHVVGQRLSAGNLYGADADTGESA